MAKIEITMGNNILKADEFLVDRSDSRYRLDKVSSLIGGFETPYGMELLSSVHWLAVHGSPLVRDVDTAIA
jgi:hypothetical protein